MLSFFPRGVLDEILNLIESVSEDFPSYSLIDFYFYKSNFIAGRPKAALLFSFFGDFRCGVPYLSLFLFYM